MKLFICLECAYHETHEPHAVNQIKILVSPPLVSLRKLQKASSHQRRGSHSNLLHFLLSPILNTDETV